MGILRRRVPKHYLPLHPQNAAGNDWLVMLEAGTIVGPSPTKLRVARATQERTVVRKFNAFLQPSYYLLVEGYNPRIHAVFFCPQLYRYDTDKKLVPLQGDEIGALIANSVEAGVNDRWPWYEPLERLPEKPVVSAPADLEFDTVVVEMPSGRGSAAG